MQSTELESFQLRFELIIIGIFLLSSLPLVVLTLLYIYSQFEVTPLGLQKLLNYLKEKYRNPPIYIHENGISLLDHPIFNLILLSV
ncbi:putative glycosidase [Helianthus annuus]|nr:putative glycosidase [Helianthus annuus]